MTLAWLQDGAAATEAAGVAIESSTRGLEFQTDGAYVAVAITVVVLTFVLCVTAWLRSGGRASIAALEALRFAIVTAVLFALAQPEWVVTEVPDESPLVAVLWDDSESMETRDVAQGDDVVSRSEYVAGRLSELVPETGLDSSEAEGSDEQGGERFQLVASPLSQVRPEDEEGENAAPVARDQRGTDFATPLTELLDRRTLRAVVLVSDGDWNEGGSPYEVAMRYRLEGVPIFTSCVGSPTRLPDIVLEPVEPPAFAIVNRPIDIPVSIDSAMPRDVATEIVLSDESGEVVRHPIQLAARRTTPDRLVFRPRSAGRVKLTVSVTPKPGELDTSNNSRTFEIDVREERLRVLLVEGFPRWEYRYLRNALVRDPGVEVDCYLTHPTIDGVGGGPNYLEAFPPKELLSSYDVVFVGDVGLGDDGLSSEQCDLIAGLVRDQASGLILMPGYGGGHIDLQETDLGELFPVDLDPGEMNGFGSVVPSRLTLTDAGRNSALTRLVPDAIENVDLWNELPGFQWHAGVYRARAGSQVLAVHSSMEGEFGRVPLLVTRTARTGKVLFMGTDAAWRWREGYEDRYHYRFWGQVIRWMAYQRSMNVGESMRLFFTPDRPRARSTIALNANVMDAGGAPLGNATVRARIEAPSGRIERIDFAPASSSNDASDRDAWGLYSATFQPREGGRHRVLLECVETNATLEAEIPVIGRPLEQIGLPARFDVMEELARITRGDVLESPSAEGLAERLRALPTPPPFVTRLRIWSHPIFGAAIALLMACFWIGRKAVGRV